MARHFDFLNKACLNYMYTPKGPKPNLSEVVAKDLNLPEEGIRNQLYLNKGVNEIFLSAVAASNGIDIKEILRFNGMPILEFYSEFVCGGILLKIKGSGSSPNHTVEAPLAFQSALAGILLIADLYLFRSGHRPLYNRSHYNPLAPIKAGLNFTHHNLEKDNSGICVCNDQAYQEVYKTKWAG